MIEDLDDRTGAGPAAASRPYRKVYRVKRVDHALAHTDAVERGNAELSSQHRERVGRQGFAGAYGVTPMGQVKMFAGIGGGR